ncbi:sulfatase [Bacteroidota bacterium]
MNRFIIYFLVLLITSCTQTVDIRPNILWIVADDLGADLGCYGEDAVYTPNLDKLATQGIRYENFFTVTAVCSPSRSSLITGMYPTSIDCHQHRTRYKKPLPDGVMPITHYFRNAGYFTFNGDFRDTEKPGKQDYNFIAENIYDGTDWTQRKEEQPFFGQIQIFYPHRPFIRDPSHPVDTAKLTIPPYYPDHPITRIDWALYLEFIQLLDIEVGKILERLEIEGLAGNTIVFFFGDQGRPHVRAKQFLYDGGINTPFIMRWPDGKNAGKVEMKLVSNIDVSVTSLILAGIKVPDHIQGMSFLESGEEEREYIISMRDRRDETVDRIRTVRNKDFKYIRNFYPERPYTQFNAYKKYRYPVLTLLEELKANNDLTIAQQPFMESSRPAEELYDLKNDPWELNNLATNIDYQRILTEMRTQLDEWLIQADKGIYPEDQAEIDFADSLMKNSYGVWMENIGLGGNVSDEEILTYWENILTPTIPGMRNDRIQP